MLIAFFLSMSLTLVFLVFALFVHVIEHEILKSDILLWLFSHRILHFYWIVAVNESFLRTLTIFVVV